MSQKSKPVAVLISDIHFTVPTLELASESLYRASEKAKSLGVPLVLCGDTLDSKAIIRAECANRLIRILEERDDFANTFILVGNHDLLNEKGHDHSLQFLSPFASVVRYPAYIPQIDAVLIPYYSNPEALLEQLDELDKADKCRTLIMHQGVQGAWMGHYVQDKTSLPPEAFANFRVVSGHYHKAQDIKCGRPRKGAVGLFTYIGNPYTLSFSEAEDLHKGYAVLMSDGLLERVPLDLRRHVIINRTVDTLYDKIFESTRKDDIIWLKVTGPDSELKKLKKSEIGQKLFGHSNFKLDLIPEAQTIVRSEKLSSLSASDAFDAIIDDLSESDSYKSYLKSLWRDII